jgi:hypothetical protein
VPTDEWNNRLTNGPSKIATHGHSTSNDKKRVHLQQFDIIHLPNLDYLTSGILRETKLCSYPSISWKLISGILLYSFFLFSPSHLQRNVDDNHDPHAHSEVHFVPSWYAKLFEANFSCSPKIRRMPSWFTKLLELLPIESHMHSTSNDKRRLLSLMKSCIHGFHIAVYIYIYIYMRYYPVETVTEAGMKGLGAHSLSPSSTPHPSLSQNALISHMN